VSKAINKRKRKINHYLQAFMKN